MRGKPEAIRCGNGLEYISAVTLAWAPKDGIRIDFIQPGQPEQNAYVERFNRTVRYDWLARHLFETLDEIHEFPSTWFWTYNQTQHDTRRYYAKTEIGTCCLTATFGVL